MPAHYRPDDPPPFGGPGFGGPVQPTGGQQQGGRGWINPMTIGMFLQGLGSLWGAISSNKASKQDRKAMAARQAQLESLILPLLGGGAGRSPGGAETALTNILSGGSETWNTGQDALMQMLRASPFDTGEMFESWEPIERRALDEALSGAFSQASGLGQRFGSAMMREEGQTRLEAAEGAAARRQSAQMGAFESDQARKQQAASALMSMLLGATGQLAGTEQSRMGGDISLLSLLFGQPIMGSQPNALPGAASDIGQLMAFLPMLMQLSQPPATSPPIQQPRR